MARRALLVTAALAAVLWLAVPTAPSIEAQVAECSGVARLFIKPDGSIQRIRILCSGECPDPRDHCKRQRSGNHHGGLREWCGCDDVEPGECHIVKIVPGKGEGGGPPSFACAGQCPDPTEQCIDVIVSEWRRPNGGLIQDVTCQCF